MLPERRTVIHRKVIMKEKEQTQNEEYIIRKMMQSSKEKAPDYLKYRIMQQIETEKTLAASKKVSRKESGDVLKDFGVIFGSMYAVLAVMIVAAYFLFGREYLQTTSFLSTVLSVASIFSLLWLISRLDSHLRKKKHLQ